MAVRAGQVVGFQSLERADPDWPGEGKLPDGWAIIATFVAQGQQGLGIGGSLFATTKVAARAAGIGHIDATIRRENAGGLRYYSAMGFRDYRETADTISKRIDFNKSI